MSTTSTCLLENVNWSTVHSPRRRLLVVDYAYGMFETAGRNHGLPGTYAKCLSCNDYVRYCPTPCLELCETFGSTRCSNSVMFQPYLRLSVLVSTFVFRYLCVTDSSHPVTISPPPFHLPHTHHLRLQCNMNALWTTALPRAVISLPGLPPAQRGKEESLAVQQVAVHGRHEKRGCRLIRLDLFYNGLPHESCSFATVRRVGEGRDRSQSFSQPPSRTKVWGRERCESSTTTGGHEGEGRVTSGVAF